MMEPEPEADESASGNNLQNIQHDIYACNAMTDK